MRQMIALEDEGERHEAAGTNRWMVSYADFVTLLFVLFLVLYAKAPKLAAPLAQAPATQKAVAPEVHPAPPPKSVDTELPTPAPAKAAETQVPTLAPTRVADTQLPTPVPVNAIETQLPTPAPAKVADPERKPVVEAPAPPKASPQQLLLDKLTRSFPDLTAAGNMTLIARKDAVVLEIADTSLFASGTAQPAPRSEEVIAKIVAAVGNGRNAVIVEGHTDNVPIKTSQYPSNWELSSARAASVARALQERGISPDRLTASGMAQTKPRSSNDTEQGRRENRRVSLIILNEGL